MSVIANIAARFATLIKNITQLADQVTARLILELIRDI